MPQAPPHRERAELELTFVQSQRLTTGCNGQVVVGRCTAGHRGKQVSGSTSRSRCARGSRSQDDLANSLTGPAVSVGTEFEDFRLLLCYV